MYLELKNNRRVYGLTREQEEVLKGHLTFDNPAYKNAKRYSKNRYITIPPYLYYYTTGKDNQGSYFECPIGVDVEKLLKYKINPMKHKGDAILWGHNCPKVEYPDFKLSLRPVQEEALNAYMQSYYNTSFSGVMKCLVSLPTGKGKTILAIKLAAQCKTRTLVLVHKDDLVEGWKNDIKLCFGDAVRPGIIKAKKREIGEHITIATVQTLSRMSSDELSKYTNEFGLVIQDECHHVGLNIFNIIDKFNSTYKLGLSATPKRSDGLDFVFDLFFGGVCYEYKAGEYDEDISSVEVRIIDSKYRYLPIMYKGQVFNYYDFSLDELPEEYLFVNQMDYQMRPTIPFHTIDNAAVLSPFTKIHVCRKIMEHYRKGHSCLVLFSQKEHINVYYRYLRMFVPEERIMLYYGDSKEKSDVLMNRAENREVLITLATYAKTTEGTNVKSWEVEFLVSSMNDEKNVEQATGRVRRRKEGKLDPVIIYDVRYSQCYSLQNHYMTRKEVYGRLHYNIKDSSAHNEEKSSRGGKLFSRGYSH